jgi:hypothetical protein
MDLVLPYSGDKLVEDFETDFWKIADFDFSKWKNCIFTCKTYEKLAGNWNFD